MLTVGSLFSGIGLLDLGLERTGFRTIWHSEKDKQASKVLAKRWPGVPNLGDVKRIDWSTVERPEVLSLGGWPCQPLSSAGKQLGRDDPRYLWPECARAIRALRPRMCIMEQSPNVLALFGGDIFCEVLGDLAQAGFDAKWAVVPASDVGAPHKRERLFLAAYADGFEPQRWGGPGVLGGTATGQSDQGLQRERSGNASWDRGEAVADGHGDGRCVISKLDGQAERSELSAPLRGHAARRSDAAPHTEDNRRTGGGHHGDGGPDLRTTVGALADADSPRSKTARSDLHEFIPGERNRTDWGKYTPAVERWARIFRPAPTPLDEKGRLNVSLPEWMMGAPENWCDGLSRTAAIKGYGNGVVVQVAEAVGRWALEGP